MIEWKRRWMKRLLGPWERGVEKQVVLQCLPVAKINRGFTRLKTLADAEFRGFSQWGEDGIIDWLVERLPEIPRSFIEFGVEDYRESNTRLLLYLRNWRGLVMDGSLERIAEIQQQDVYWRYDLTAKCAFIDRENINSLIAASGYSGDIGLLSIDLDGNDYWIWQAIAGVSPVIVICEYNAVFGDLCPLSVPYRADFQRTRAHFSNLYFGASLCAFVRLGEEKGYTFVGTTSAGCNAFFIRNDFALRIASALDEITAFPSFLRESRDEKGNLTFVGREQRQKLVQDLTLVDLSTHRTTTLAECGEINSTEWSSYLNTSVCGSDMISKKIK